MMHAFTKIVSITLVTLLLQHFGRLSFTYMSYGNTILKHYPGECRTVDGFRTRGSEDMTLLPSGQLIITSGLNMPGARFDYSRYIARGAMYVLDTRKPQSQVEKLKVLGFPAESHFEPHGIDYWVHENKSVSLFVVTHQPESVVRLLYDGSKTLMLTKVYENSTFMTNLNSVFATGEDSFYFTNIFRARMEQKFFTMVEFLLFMPLANVGFVRGDNYISAANSLFMPNGVTGDDRYVYVATKDVLKVFTRNTDGSLALYKEIHLSIGSMDNIKLDSVGDLWIGSQPIAREIVEYLDNPRTTKVHSMIIRVRDPAGDAEMESVFVDDASLIQASSVGVYTEGQLFIGSVNDNMLSCDVRYLSSKRG